MSIITSLFNYIKERNAKREAERQLGRDYESAVSAMSRHDTDGLRKILENVADKNAFVDGYYNGLMKNAIEGGNLETFKVMHGYIDNPNASLTFQIRVEKYDSFEMYTNYASPLYHAMNTGKVDIAAYLAAAESTDISKGFQDYKGNRVSLIDKATEIINSGEGMRDVLATLLERSAAQHDKQAANLRDLAQKL